MILCLLPAGGCLFAPAPPPGPPVDTELAQTTTVARLAFGRGATLEAITLYRRALNRARAMDDPAAIGDAAYNLGACFVQAGRFDEARLALREAESETLRAAGATGSTGSGANVADVLLVEAKAALLAGKAAEAVGFADRVTRDRASHPGAAQRVQADVLRGDVACDAGDPAAASRALADARRDAGRGPSAAVRAEADGLEARVWRLKGDPARSAPLFDRQAEELRQAGHYRDMARALARAGRAWADAKSPAAAADRLFRAGRALAAQGEVAEAGQLLADAETAANQAGDEKVVERIGTLSRELKPATRPGD